MENSELHFEEINSSHVAQLCTLHFSVFGQKKDPSYFIRMYDLEQNNETRLAIVAILNQEIVGFIGARIVLFSNGEKQIRLAESAESMIHESLRGKRVYYQLYQLAIEKIKTNNISIFYGRPNDDGYKFHKKLGWKELTTTVRFHIKSVPFRTAKISRLVGLESLKQKRLSKLLGDFRYTESLDSVFSIPEYYTVQLNDQFFRTKRVEPYYCIELYGCVFYLKYAHHVSVGAMKIVRADFQLDKALAKLKLIVRKCFIHEIVFHLEDVTSLEVKELKKHLFEQPSFKLLYFPMDKLGENLIKECKFSFMDSEIF